MKQSQTRPKARDRSDIHALLNSDTQPLAKDTGSTSRPSLDAAKNSKNNGNTSIDVIKRVADLSIYSPKTKSPAGASPALSEISRPGSPGSSYSVPVGQSCSPYPYSNNSPGTNSRDEMAQNQSGEKVTDKRQRRLQRNRLAAQESRQKKKVYVSDLEHKVKRLEEENLQLFQHVLLLSDQLDTGSILETITDPSPGGSPGPQEAPRPFHHQPLLPSTSRAMASIPQHLLPSRPSSTPPYFPGTRESPTNNNCLSTVQPE